MSDKIKPDRHLGEDFLKASRAFESALSRCQEKIRKDNFTIKLGDTDRHSLNVSQLEVLHAVLISPNQKGQNEIAENVELNKGAFSRLSQALSESGYVTLDLDKTGEKPTKLINLTKKGEEVATLYQTKLDIALDALSRSPEAITLAKIIARANP